MFEVILAVTIVSDKIGIGKGGRLPWYCPSELQIFREKTADSVLIMGKNTVRSLPKALVGRIILTLTTTLCDDLDTFYSLEDALAYAEKTYPHKKVFVCGGGKLYDYVFREMPSMISKLHLSVMKDPYECDTFVQFDMNLWSIEEKLEEKQFNYYLMKYTPHGEGQYLKLIKEILHKGKKKIGRNGETLSLFCQNMVFDLRDGFPLLTTKQMFFIGIIEEFLFFFRGETDTKKLEAKGINIWKENTSRKALDSLGLTDRKEGDMGPMYGFQWRNFNANVETKKGGTDQLEKVIDELKTDPDSRRIIMTTFNPAQADEGVLYPCHSIVIQFYVDGNDLDMYVYNRSADLFLGVPFNIASSALLLHFVSKITGYNPRYFYLTLGDVHIYDNLINQCRTQIERIPYTFPLLITPQTKSIGDVEALTSNDFKLENRRCYPPIKGEMRA